MPLRRCLTAILVFVSLLLSCKTPQSQTDEDQAASSLLDLSPDPNGFFEPLRPSRVQEVLAREFRRVPVRVGSNVFSLKFLDFAALTGAAGASVQTLDPGTYLRTDTWRLSTDLWPGALIQDAAANALPVALTIKGGRDVIWSRPFDDKMTALSALPPSPADLPLDSGRALQMGSGEFVSLPVYMGLTLGVARGNRTPSLAVQATTGIFWSGEFRLNVIRMDGDFVRVKVAPKDTRGFYLSTEANAHLSMFGYGPFGLIDLDRQADRLAGLDLFRMSFNRVDRGEAMAIDYVINLADRHGAMAFDAILRDTLRLKARALGTQAVDGLSDLAFGDITIAETLHALDADLAPADKRVARIFRGGRFYNEDRLGLRLGTKLLRWDNQKSLSLNVVSAYDRYDAAQSWSYQVFSTGRKQSSWFSPLRRNYGMSAVALFDSDRGGGSLQNLIFTWDTSERYARAAEKAAVAWSLYAVLGNYYGQLGLDSVFQTVPSDKFIVKAKIALQSRLFDQLAQLAARDPDGFEKYLWAAVSLISPRFEGRQGPRTPAPAASALGQAKRLLAGSLLAAQNTVRNLLNAQWEGVRGTTVRTLVAETARIDQLDPAVYFERMMKLLYRDESAQEIMPAYFLALGELLQIEPWAEVEIVGGDQTVLKESLGSNPGQDFQDFASDTFQRINQTGYER